MALKTMRFLNLLLTGVLTGNEFGGFMGFHSALYELLTEAHARAERTITSRFGKIMPPFMTAAITGGRSIRTRAGPASGTAREVTTILHKRRRSLWQAVLMRSPLTSVGRLVIRSTTSGEVVDIGIFAA